jgi:ferredoxin
VRDGAFVEHWEVEPRLRRLTAWRFEDLPSWFSVSADDAWRLSVGPECIGAGVCAGTAPERFVLGADGRARAVRELVDADETVLDAVAACPMEAISVYDARTGEPIEPAG